MHSITASFPSHYRPIFAILLLIRRILGNPRFLDAIAELCKLYQAWNKPKSESAGLSDTADTNDVDSARQSILEVVNQFDINDYQSQCISPSILSRLRRKSFLRQKRSLISYSRTLCLRNSMAYCQKGYSSGPTLNGLPS